MLSYQSAKGWAIRCSNMYNQILNTIYLASSKAATTLSVFSQKWYIHCNCNTFEILPYFMQQSTHQLVMMHFSDLEPRVASLNISQFSPMLYVTLF